MIRSNKINQVMINAYENFQQTEKTLSKRIFKIVY